MKSVLVSIAGLVALTSAAAIASPVEKRADVGVYLCNGVNFTGYCVHIVSPSGVCVPLASDLNDKTNSAGPDQGSLCYFYVNPGCDINGAFFHYDYPGVSDLSKTPINGPPGSTHNYADQISSYACFTV